MAVASVRVEDEGPYVVVIVVVPALGLPTTTAPDELPLAACVLVYGVAEGSSHVVVVYVAWGTKYCSRSEAVLNLCYRLLASTVPA